MFECEVFESSAIYSVIYFPDDRELTITFNSQRQVLYSYYDVPHTVFLELVDNPHPCSFFNRFIRNSYCYHRDG